MTLDDASRVMACLRAGALDDLLPAAAVALLRCEARRVASSAPQWVLRLDDGMVVHASALRRMRKVPAVEMDEALGIASRRPSQLDRLVAIGRTASGELVNVAVLPRGGWRPVDGHWRHDAKPDWRASAEDRAAHVWLSGAPYIAWESPSGGINHSATQSKTKESHAN
ncbi:MAG: hypothetical protein WBB07_15555 [Mycobacterium sp.]